MQALALFLLLGCAAAALAGSASPEPRGTEAPPISPRSTLACGRHRRLRPGFYYIESPNYPANYPNDQECRWVLKARDGSPVDMYCEDFQLEYHNNCAYDYLKVNGTKYCGGNAPAISGVRLRVIFFSDYSETFRGFRCVISVGGVTPPTTTTEATTPATTMPPSTDCCCGVPNRAARIVGGEETEVYEYPWQAGLVSAGSSRTWCGGTIINSLYVLTAAHCTAGETPNGLEVLIREHIINNNDGQVRKQVAEIIDHPDYISASGSGYDISLLRLTEAISFPTDNTIAPACLPTDANEQYVGADAVVTGWGSTSSGGSQATTLQEVTVPVISNQQCRQSYGSINPTMICAGLSEGGKDSCQGDSGGPMVTLDGGKYSVIGVVSWGRGCALPGYPGVYARVTSVLNWIRQNSANGLFCQA